MEQILKNIIESGFSENVEEELLLFDKEGNKKRIIKVEGGGNLLNPTDSPRSGKEGKGLGGFDAYTSK